VYVYNKLRKPGKVRLDKSPHVRSDDGNNLELLAILWHRNGSVASQSFTGSLDPISTIRRAFFRTTIFTPHIARSSKAPILLTPSLLCINFVALGQRETTLKAGLFLRKTLNAPNSL